MYYILSLIFLFGLGIGSFLNVVLFRMTTEKKFWNGRSECMHCKHILSWYELIPVLSYILQRGKCRICKKNISLQYPLIELVTAFLFTAYIYTYAQDLQYLYSLPKLDFIKIFLILILITQLIIVFMYDLKYQLIPVIQLRAIQILGLIWFFIEYYQSRIIPDSIITVLTSVGITLFLYFITKKQGIGWGDVELFAGLSWFIPLMWSVPFFFGSFFIGTIWGLVLMVIHKNSSLKQRIAFGPSIILSFLIVYSLIQIDIVPTINIWYYLIMVKI